MQPMSGAAFFDLDRTLLAGASGEVFSTAMKAAGLIKFGKVLGKTVVSDVEIERVVASINEVAA